MKIIVVSDTHRRIEPFIKDIEKYDDIDLIIHLGDMVADAKEIKSRVKFPLMVVRGNNDYEANNTSWNEILEIEGNKIFATHGHKEGIDFGVNTILRRAKELDANIVLYGHTHVFMDKIYDKIRLINPGSAGYDRSGEYESYIIMDINSKEIKVDRIKL